MPAVAKVQIIFIFTTYFTKKLVEKLNKDILEVGYIRNASNNTQILRVIGRISGYVLKNLLRLIFQIYVLRILQIYGEGRRVWVQTSSFWGRIRP